MRSVMYMLMAVGGIIGAFAVPLTVCRLFSCGMWWRALPLFIAYLWAMGKLYADTAGGMHS